MPSIGLTISGDGVYNIPYHAECDEQAIKKWLRALDKIESLHPKAVVDGHGMLDRDRSLATLGKNATLPPRAVASLVCGHRLSVELYETMLSLHPNRAWIAPGGRKSVQAIPKLLALTDESRNLPVPRRSGGCLFHECGLRRPPATVQGPPRDRLHGRIAVGLPS